MKKWFKCCDLSNMLIQTCLQNMCIQNPHLDRSGDLEAGRGRIYKFKGHKYDLKNINLLNYFS